LKTAIIGCGIAGMTTALAFERAGADVTLFEQAERLSVVGAGIQLGPNAVHVLDALGLGDDLRKVASFPEAVFLRDAVHGRELARIPFGQAAQDRFGAPFLQLHRAELSQLLFEAVNARGIDTRFGATARRLMLIRLIRVGRTGLVPHSTWWFIRCCKRTSRAQTL